MREVRGKIDSVLSCNLPVLIQGETGTGKEMIARFLHTRSKQHEAPFIKLRCSAIPAGLLEGELFSWENGSLTGASQDRLGLAELAHGGTLFLNEISDMTLELQAKLVRLLQDGHPWGMGDHEDRMGRIRVICATNVDLHDAVESGAFRADLFSHIDLVLLRISPLRDRKKDIPQLCEYFLQKLARQFQRTIPELSPFTLHLLKQWDWPGNLLELKNWVARAIILGDDEALAAELRRQIEMANGLIRRQPRLSSPREATDRAISAVTNALILKAMHANRWNRRKTAEELHMSYRALLSKWRDVGILQRRRSRRGRPPAN